MELTNLKNTDPEVAEAIEKELQRQNDHIELIASENFVSEAILEAQGSVLTNKYAEGYPKKRYYGGCQNCDTIEQLAIDRAKELFGAEHANVQPHSGSQANMAVYFAMLNPGDKILGADLSQSGHLTHGAKVNFSGQIYESHFYGLNEEGLIDYDEVLRIAKEVQPKMIVAGASAYSRIIDFAKFREIADEVGAYLLCDIAHIAGLVATGLHPSPVPYADFVTSTTHKTLRGGRGGIILCKEKYAKAIDKAVCPGTQGGSLQHVVAAKAVCFKEAMTEEFKEYQRQILRNAQALAGDLISYGFNIVSGGTDNHLMLVDLRNKGITGKEMERRLGLVNVTTNKNTIPNETESPLVTSGIRLGTPAMTTRGMKEVEMKVIADVIRIMAEDDYENHIETVKNKVLELCSKFPIYK